MFLLVVGCWILQHMLYNYGQLCNTVVLQLTVTHVSNFDQLIFVLSE